MEQDVFSYLDKDYRYLNNYIRKFNEVIFISPHTAMVNGKMFIKNLTREISKLEGYGLLNDMTQLERVKKLQQEKVLQDEILQLFNSINTFSNEERFADKKWQLEIVLNIHKSIYEITCWFVQNYINPSFKASIYERPMLFESKSKDLTPKVQNVNTKNEQDIDAMNVSKNEEKDVFEDLMIEEIINNKMDKKCLIQELARLKESSKEAVESLGLFTPFKRYMHIEREAQKELENLIFKANKSSKAQLILVCGSVGDGKSHIISYFNNKYYDIMNNFTLHNDATESLEPSKTSMDTLNEVLDNFSDEKIKQSTEKFILAINLGTLNNFIDSKYGERFSLLRKYVEDKKILETSINSSRFDENSSFQFVNFSDYHIFTLKDGKVHSNYIKSLISKITDSLELNIFYNSYKKNCTQCINCNCCPIKANYELLFNDRVQESIIDLLVQCIIKKKIIISTRALLNFMYELIVPRPYIDVNSPTFKNKISKLNKKDYIKSLMPNVIFDHRELSFIFEALNDIDPLNIRNEKVDDFIIDFNNAVNLLDFFKKYIDYPKGYMDKLTDINFSETEDKNIRFELLKLFIRSYYICGREDLFSLRDDVYDDYMNAVFYWNRGDKAKLKNVYNNVRDGIINWNGEADKDHINIFMGKNQIKYKVSEKIELKVDTSNLPKSVEDDLKKFIGILKLKYKSENSEGSYEIDIDYNLYKLLIQVNNGYRPNKKDKNHFIKFIEFINKLEETGSQNEELLFTEKNRESNKQFKLEYDEEFETYRFVEI